MAGSVDLALDAATPRFLRMFWGLIPGAWSFALGRAEVREEGPGSRLVGEMIGTPLWLVLTALAAWGAVLAVAVVLFMQTPEPIPFGVVAIVVLLGFMLRLAYRQVCRVDTEEILAILRNVLQPPPDSGWWEETTS